MIKLVTGSLGLIVSLLLFAGFNFTNYLSTDEAAVFVGQGTVDVVKAYKAYLYIFLGLLFLTQQIWLRWPKPASHSEVEAIRSIIVPLLERVIAEYAREVASMSGSSALCPAVRCNIMLPTWRRFLLGRYLKIYYSHGGPAGIVYPEGELDLEWRWKSGTCGYAWAKNRPTIFDSNDSRFSAPAKRLDKKQRTIVGDIHSVLSVPICLASDSKVVGILSLDSKFNVDNTRFANEQVVGKLIASAATFPNLLFADGVKT